MAARLLALLNLERQRVGRPPLSLHARASTLALQRAHRYLEKDDLMPDPALGRMLHSAGSAGGGSSQYRGAFYHVDEMAWHMLNEPSTRSIIIDRRVSNVGAGFVSGPHGTIKAWVYFF